MANIKEYFHFHVRLRSVWTQLNRAKCYKFWAMPSWSVADLEWRAFSYGPKFSRFRAFYFFGKLAKYRVWVPRGSAKSATVVVYYNLMVIFLHILSSALTMTMTFTLVCPGGWRFDTVSAPGKLSILTIVRDCSHWPQSKANTNFLSIFQDLICHKTTHYHCINVINSFYVLL